LFFNIEDITAGVFSMKHFWLLAIFLLIFLNSFFEAFGQQNVSVYRQPDSPLQISKVSAKWGVEKLSEGDELPSLIVNYSLQNESGKAIRAYTISLIEGEYTKSNAGISDLGIVTKSSQLLSPNQSRIATFHQISTDVPQGNVKIAVDFVEFTDGSTWGLDASDSADMVAGFRAGAEAAQEYLQTVERNRKDRQFDTLIKWLL
jgi:hypothetical protein